MILNITFGWHLTKLTVMEVFFCYFYFLGAGGGVLLLREHSNFSVLAVSTAIPSHVFTSEVSFICTFLPCQGGWGGAGGRSGFSPTECCVLSPATCWILCFPPSFAPIFLPSSSSSPSGALICTSLLSIWRIWLWRQQQGWSRPRCHRTTTC